MKYYLKSKSKKLIELTDNMIVGGESDGIVYGYGNKAIKILHMSNRIPEMTEKKAKLFKNKLNLNSSTNIIDLVYNENKEYSGYAMEYIINDIEKYSNINTTNLLKNIEQLIYDSRQFTGIQCNLQDLARPSKPGNDKEVNYFMNENGIILMDFDNVEIDRKMDNYELKIRNERTISEVLFDSFKILIELKLNGQLETDTIFRITDYMIDIYDDIYATYGNINLLEFMNKEFIGYNFLAEYLDSRVMYIKKKLKIK